MDYYGFSAARRIYEGRDIDPPTPYRTVRDELQDVKNLLRQRYGRRTLFRLAEVEAAIDHVRGAGGFATPPRRLFPDVRVPIRIRRRVPVEIDLTCTETL